MNELILSLLKYLGKAGIQTGANMLGNKAFGGQQQGQQQFGGQQQGQQQFGGQQQGQQGSFWGGIPGQTRTFSPVNPQQESGMMAMLQRGLSGMEGNNLDFGPIEDRARTQFAQQTVPSIAQRYASMGSGAAPSSPELMSQLGQAGAGLDADLAAQRATYGLDKNRAMQGMVGLGLQPTRHSLYIPRSPGMGENLGSAAASSIPYLLQMLASSMWGKSSSKGGK